MMVRLILELARVVWAAMGVGVSALLYWEQVVR